jgi:hypothetical protein
VQSAANAEEVRARREACQPTAHCVCFACVPSIPVMPNAGNARSSDTLQIGGMRTLACAHRTLPVHPQHDSVAMCIVLKGARLDGAVPWRAPGEGCVLVTV